MATATSKDQYRRLWQRHIDELSSMVADAMGNYPVVYDDWQKIKGNLNYILEKAADSLDLPER